MKNYPKTDDEISAWNQYISTKEIYPIELLVNKNSEKYIGLQKIFRTLSLDKVSPITFIDAYIKAKIDNNQESFTLDMTNLFLTHKVNKSLSEGQSIKSARTQTVARLLCLSFGDLSLSEIENFKKAKITVRKLTKGIRA